jgi:hypothetical protein
MIFIGTNNELLHFKLNRFKIESWHTRVFNYHFPVVDQNLKAKWWYSVSKYNVYSILPKLEW